MKPQRPSREELLAAAGKTLPDVIGPGLDVLFCGINPGLYTAAIGHHFGRPGNRFWPALHRAGFTPRQLSPYEEQELLRYGCGITNLVARATTAADEVTPEELRRGMAALERKVRKYTPRFLAVLGVGAYRTAFGDANARVGLQEKTIESTRLWLLPNTSGLNANYKPAQFAECFRELREAVRSS